MPRIWRWPGPLANASLAIVAVICIHLGIYFGYFLNRTASYLPALSVRLTTVFRRLLQNSLAYLFSLNLLLFIFNLIPLPPMDGSALFPLVVSEDRALKIMDALHQRAEPGRHHHRVDDFWRVVPPDFSDCGEFALSGFDVSLIIIREFEMNQKFNDIDAVISRNCMP
ncbi:MAG: hypothetical protein R3C26_12655 [Calditrichia bacterium]